MSRPESTSVSVMIKRAILIYVVLLFAISIYAGGNGKKCWSVYFTSSGSGRTDKACNPEGKIIRLIKTSKSFYGAFYDITSRNVAKALIDAHKNGTDIKLVIEKDNAGKPVICSLADSGIQIVTDDRRGLMHNKFAVIDGSLVWTGSYNLTHSGAFRNNNNAILINSKALAEIYYSEFLEMFKYRIFGNRKEPGPFSKIRNRYYVRAGGTGINVYFSPENNIERILLKRIKKARKSIHFMVFSFTSDRIGEEIIKRFKSGVKVFGLMETYGAKSRYSEYIKMKLEGIPVKLDRNRYKMHHKVLIIDERFLVVGSYNFSKGANKRNDENILIIDDPYLADEYLKEFYRLYK